MIKSEIKVALFEQYIPTGITKNFTPLNQLTDYGINLWRSFIYGDYSNADYLKAIEMQSETDKNKLRQYVIFSYCSLVAYSFNCSYSYAQKCIVELFGKQSLESINQRLIDELMQLGK